MFVLLLYKCYFCELMAGIYIHIPFCKKRCIYCDFYSTTDNRLTESYIGALENELSARINEIGIDNVSTIYIGGGTPSQLTIQQLYRLIASIKNIINFEKVLEFTIEVNPDDVNFEYMQACRTLGINRVSMGIQSFVDAELEIINRRHNSAQAVETVKIMRSAGFDNISIDLIYGLPLQTLDSWRYSVAEAIKLDVPHISCYNLSYEEDTLLYKKRESGEIIECNEEDCITMYEVLTENLKEAGYLHYEISNYCKPDSFSRHNSNYWNLTPYLGLGASAHSYDGKVRRYNPDSIHEYMKKVGECGIAYEEDDETEWEKYNEYIMIGLRTMWGVSLSNLEKMFSNELYNHFIAESRRFINSGELKEENGAVVLTEKGIMLTDYVVRSLMFVP